MILRGNYIFQSKLNSGTKLRAAYFLPTDNNVGVLVAISIPVFTAQLRKARTATNQANARAAYAAAVAQFLEDNNGTAHGDDAAESYSYKYIVKDGKLAENKAEETVANAPTADDSTGKKVVSDWKPDTKYDANEKVGDSVASVWHVILDTEGTLTGFLGEK